MTVLLHPSNLAPLVGVLTMTVASFIGCPPLPIFVGCALFAPLAWQAFSGLWS